MYVILEHVTVTVKVFVVGNPYTLPPLKKE